MFCSKCGKEIPDDSAFCSNCGNVISGSVRSDVSSAATEQRNTREETSQIVDTLTEYFSEKNYLYRELDLVNKNLVKVNMRSYYWKMLVAISFFGTLIPSLIALAVDFEYAGGVATVAFLIATTLALIIPAIVKVVRRNELNKRQANLADEITDYYNQLNYCPLGVEYTDPEILAELKALIKSGRADTLKEAINTMVDDIHKNNMEAAAFTAAQNAYVAAKASRISAVTGTISLFKK